jgi:hypothetical protein
VLESLAASHFAPHEGEAFLVSQDGGVAVELMLISVTEFTKGVPSPGERVPFSLLFRGPADRPLSQRIHRLEHPVMGALDLFIVPLGPREGGLVYEAVFN